MLKRFSILLIAFLLIISSLTGCAVKKESAVTAKTTTLSDSNVSKSSSTSEQTITDMAGRKLTIPSEVKKTFSTSQIGIIMLYTLCPDKLCGWGFNLAEEEKKYISSKYYSLPVLGTWSGQNGTGNIEQIIKVHPDVIFSMGTLTQSDIDASQKIQDKTGIPVIMVDGSLTKMDKAYDFMGNILNEKTKAKELGDYCNKTITDIKTQVEKIPANKRKKVYYAEGLKGLETDPKGSFHTEVLDFVGGINIADVQVKQGFGRAQVSMEQLLSWNPDVIIAGYDKDANGGGFNNILTDSSFKSIKAVSDKKVYQVPNMPYDWFDRPPSVNRILGVKWLANLLYPDYVKLDIKKEVINFYDKFYHHKLTDQEVNDLLKNAK